MQWAGSQVGNGDLTLNEQRSHFALWALLKSPLLLGADLRRLSPKSLAILKAREVLALSQDNLGVPGDLIWKRGSKEVLKFRPALAHRARPACSASYQLP
jgi:alpha-galactosidase